MNQMDSSYVSFVDCTLSLICFVAYVTPQITAPITENVLDHDERSTTYNIKDNEEGHPPPREPRHLACEG